MAYTAELHSCVEDERWEGFPKVLSVSDHNIASDVCRSPLGKIGGTLFTEWVHYSMVSQHYDTGRVGEIVTQVELLLSNEHCTETR